MPLSDRPIDQAIDMARAERETLRWVLVTALWHARPYGALESLLLSCAHDIPLMVTAHAVRQELAWLEDCALVRIDRTGPIWSATLTARGQGVYEYREDAPKGLARPARW